MNTYVSAVPSVLASWSLKLVHHFCTFRWPSPHQQGKSTHRALAVTLRCCPSTPWWAGQADSSEQVRSCPDVDPVPGSTFAALGSSRPNIGPELPSPAPRASRGLASCKRPPARARDCDITQPRVVTLAAATFCKQVEWRDAIAGLQFVAPPGLIQALSTLSVWAGTLPGRQLRRGQRLLRVRLFLVVPDPCSAVPAS